MFNIDKFVKHCCSILAFSQFFKWHIDEKLFSHVADFTGIVRTTCLYTFGNVAYNT